MTVSTAALASLALLERARAEGRIRTHEQPAPKKQGGWTNRARVAAMRHAKLMKERKVNPICPGCGNRFKAYRGEKECWECRQK